MGDILLAQYSSHPVCINFFSSIGIFLWHIPRAGIFLSILCSNGPSLIISLLSLLDKFEKTLNFRPIIFKKCKPL